MNVSEARCLLKLYQPSSNRVTPARLADCAPPSASHQSTRRHRVSLTALLLPSTKAFAPSPGCLQYSCRPCLHDNRAPLPVSYSRALSDPMLSSAARGLLRPAR